MSLNLEDIAKISGVSRSTVSRVINGHPAVSERTRKKVLQVIQEQNFRPNLAARALVTHQTRTLSLVIPQAIAYAFTDPYFPTLIQGVTAKANEFDYAVMLWVGSGDEEDRFAERVMNNSLFDGVLIASAVSDDLLIPRLAKAGFPLVIIGPPPQEGLNYIDVDNQRGAQVAVSHLIRLGWRRIGTIAGPQNMGAARARLEGYRLAMERAGRPVDETLIVYGSFDEASGYLKMRALLQRKVDAVFVASDAMAHGALRAIHEHGLRIPEDIAVVGFDDLPMSASTTPALTTVRQPIQDLGSMATQVLIDLINGAVSEPCHMVLGAQLIVRDTCGATAL
ncbi:MAG: LacI family DNA-binding transcriptional regulator [Burkholderiales bacterium]|nr:LacI family DNA-binding transcriptional regulator [Anaerolineae bacterium]